MKNLALVFAIFLFLLYVSYNAYESREDVESYMNNDYTYTSGDILFLAEYNDGDILMVTDSTNEHIKSIKPLDQQYDAMIGFPNHIIELKGETIECVNYSTEKKEKVSCEKIANSKPLHYEKVDYSDSFEKFLNINNISTKDYVILQ